MCYIGYNSYRRIYSNIVPLSKSSKNGTKATKHLHSVIHEIFVKIKGKKICQFSEVIDYRWDEWKKKISDKNILVDYFPADIDDQAVEVAYTLYIITLHSKMIHEYWI